MTVVAVLLSFEGVQTRVVQHPIFACSRMNLSENNKAEVEDHVYVQYRHYTGHVPHGAIYSIALSPNGKRIAAADVSGPGKSPLILPTPFPP